MRIRVAPSLLAADFGRLAGEIEEVQNAGADLLHLDIMDGHFVPNLTFGPPVVRSLASYCRIPLDAHLMVEEPEPLLAELAEVGVARVAVHVEACCHLHRTLSRLRARRFGVGIAINPATPLAAIGEALAWVDFVLVMTVDPGLGGQALIPEMVDKVRRLAEITTARGLEIAVDGGVSPDTAGALVSAGATTLIAGSSVFGTADRSEAIRALRRAAEEETR